MSTNNNSNNDVSSAENRHALDNYMNSGAYLPDFMRDLHDNKKIFKAIEDFIVVNRRKLAKEAMMNCDGKYMGNVDWSEASVYVTDIFLHFLFHHGYTIQKADPVPGAEFFNLEDTLKEWEAYNSKKQEEAREQRRSAMNGGV